MKTSPRCIEKKGNQYKTPGKEGGRGNRPNPEPKKKPEQTNQHQRRGREGSRASPTALKRSGPGQRTGPGTGPPKPGRSGGAGSFEALARVSKPYAGRGREAPEERVAEKRGDGEPGGAEPDAQGESGTRLNRG